MHCISLGDLKVSSKDVLIFKGPSLGYYSDVDQAIFLCMKVEIVGENCFINNYKQFRGQVKPLIP